ncbi:MAG: bifunctional 2-C-methyl-D-erythritol 4-phosphate cytidylyltransferase/2-C-methyl-D-erythritol 2,4-cyclodiphosphate synthase [Pseudomonadota bacterium]
MQFAAVIVAAGRGQRAGGGIPKQYRALGGAAVLTRTLRPFLAHPDLAALTVVVHPDDADLLAEVLGEWSDPRILDPVPGGADRAASVHAGLARIAALPAPPAQVLIHDAARPFVTRQIIDGVLAGLETAPAAFPALPVVDALWRGADGSFLRPEDRAGLWRAQTPQGFHFPAILEAHAAHAGSAADDIAIAHAAGWTVAITEGSAQNFKITTPEDFLRAEEQLGAFMEHRTGTGFDVHALVEGPGVTLCGVEIAHDRALSGHSDADVGLHAITDAVFGALAEGDIGTWFPPSEAEWKGADSRIFLEKAVERVAARGGRIVHLDCTLICERPKIGPHASAMRARVAEICGIETDRVSIKATTTERLGFPGRGEGIAAMASATIRLG